MNFSNSLPRDAFICITSSTSSLSSTQLFRMVFMTFIYLTFFLLGVIGNGLAIATLIQYKQSRTITENYLLHLAMANLLLVLTFPFSAVDTIVGWVFGGFLCKTIHAIYKINFYCSSLLLGCISFDRYLAIVHAVEAYKRRKTKQVQFICMVIWVLCFLLSLPDIILMEVETTTNRTSCSFAQGITSSNWLLVMRFLYHVVGFFLPLAIMSYCYAMIIQTLCQSHRVKKQRAIRVAITVTGVFFVCWTPFNICLFVETLIILKAVEKNCTLQTQLDNAIIVTEALGFMQSCLNPVMYTFIGVKFRNHLLKIFRDLRCIKQTTMERFFKLKQVGTISESENPTSVSSF
ncbi:C-X-C chemokine receptor type 5 [Latimeria chalumnae]|nr:PREDICTED: C-X-C chemokine receptor type 5 [Latimeria chalumnae]|eukprot:XP_014350387.1 PREDICTED: C-X-C chemokine receptor type 5 [Latimeria chalumnae]